MERCAPVKGDLLFQGRGSAQSQHRIDQLARSLLLHCTGQLQHHDISVAMSEISGDALGGYTFLHTALGGIPFYIQHLEGIPFYIQPLEKIVFNFCV